MRALALLAGGLIHWSRRKEELDYQAPWVGARSNRPSVSTIVVGVGLVLGVLGGFLWNGTLMLVGATLIGLGLIAIVVGAIVDAFA